MGVICAISHRGPGSLCKIEQHNLADNGPPQRSNFFTHERRPPGLFYGTRICTWAINKYSYFSLKGVLFDIAHSCIYAIEDLCDIKQKTPLGTCRSY